MGDHTPADIDEGALFETLCELELPYVLRTLGR